MRAIAFRYEWPEQPGLKDFNVMDELTEFAFRPITRCYGSRPSAPGQRTTLCQTRLSGLLQQTRLEHGDATAGDNPKLDPIKA